MILRRSFIAGILATLASFYVPGVPWETELSSVLADKRYVVWCAPHIWSEPQGMLDDGTTW